MKKTNKMNIYAINYRKKGSMTKRKRKVKAETGEKAKRKLNRLVKGTIYISKINKLG